MDEGGTILRNPTAVALSQSVGVSYMRGGILWRSVEPQEGVFNYTLPDSVLNQMSGAGFLPAIFIFENPDWAANTPCGPIDTTDPTKVAAFSTFMFNLASRYPQVKLWALYNEPDNSVYAATGNNSGGCFGDNTTNDINGNGVNDRADYAVMLAAAWQAVHQGNPDAQLAIGALAYDSFDSATAPTWYVGGGNGLFSYNFLPELLAYMQAHPLPQGQQYADMLMFNYYDSYSQEWQKVSTQYGISGKAEWLQKQMALYGISLPLFVGETGMNSLPVGVNAQATCLDMTMVRGYASGFRGIIWWTFQDAAPLNFYFGVVDQNLVPKPSYSAYQNLINELDGYVYTGTLTNSTGFEGVEGYRFKNGTQVKAVVWSNALVLPINFAACATSRSSRKASFGAGVSKLWIVDMMGQSSIINDNGTGDLDTRVGYIAIRVASVPEFVQLNP